MSRALPHSRDTLASSVAAEAASSIASAGGAALVLGDAADRLAKAIAESGRTVRRWHRFLAAGQEHGPWPPAGSFEQVWVRLPRSGLESQMLLAAATARVGPDGWILVYGAKDEGIRSVDRHRPEALSPFQTRLVKRRCRVLASRRMPAGESSEHRVDTCDALDAWRRETTLDWGSGPKPWIYYPGMFSHGRLDPGTALLIESLPPVPEGARVLDFGAGSGIIGAAILDRTPGAVVHLVDSDAVSLAAAAVNVPTAKDFYLEPIQALSGPYDLIVSNPPIHEGKRETLRIVDTLVDESRRMLDPEGRLLLVVQRRMAIEARLSVLFGRVRTVADQGPFRVWEARL